MQNNPIVRKIVDNLTGRAERSNIELYWDFLFIRHIIGFYVTPQEANEAIKILLKQKTIKKGYVFWSEKEKSHNVSDWRFYKALKAGFFLCPDTGKQVKDWQERLSVVYIVPKKK